jgi:protein-tyrosine phosphatase
LTFDYICDGQFNYDYVIELAENQQQKKSQTYFEWIISKWKVDVPDPYFGLPNGFEVQHARWSLRDNCKKLIIKTIT